MQNVSQMAQSEANCAAPTQWPPLSAKRLGARRSYSANSDKTTVAQATTKITTLAAGAQDSQTCCKSCLRYGAAPTLSLATPRKLSLSTATFNKIVGATTAAVAAPIEPQQSGSDACKSLSGSVRALANSSDNNNNNNRIKNFLRIKRTSRANASCSSELAFASRGPDARKALRCLTDHTNSADEYTVADQVFRNRNRSRVVQVTSRSAATTTTTTPIASSRRASGKCTRTNVLICHRLRLRQPSIAAMRWPLFALIALSSVALLLIALRLVVTVSSAQNDSANDYSEQHRRHKTTAQGYTNYIHPHARAQTRDQHQAHATGGGSHAFGALMHARASQSTDVSADESKPQNNRVPDGNVDDADNNNISNNNGVMIANRTSATTLSKLVDIAEKSFNASNSDTNAKLHKIHKSSLPNDKRIPNNKSADNAEINQRKSNRLHQTTLRKMTNGKQVASDAPEDSVSESNDESGASSTELSANNRIKCLKTKYDRVIAQKLSLNELSKPIRKGGRFDNPFPGWDQKGVFDLVGLAISSSEVNLPSDPAELDKTLPILKPDFNHNNKNGSSEFRATWIGHSTVLIQVDGYNILTDPIFSDRASLSQYVGPKRIRRPACTIAQLPRIDIVIVSHNHYDHLDSSSVQELNDRFGRACRWIVPLGMGEYLDSMRVQNYVELDWWQKDCFHVAERKLPLGVNPISMQQHTSQPKQAVRRSASPRQQSQHDTHNGNSSRAARSSRTELAVYLTPAQHWCRRGVFDTNKVLWGSFTLVSSTGATFFFTGDSGYCGAFKEIGKVFGPFTGAAIPIGAYNPRWFMKASHVDPQEAVQIHRDLRCAKSFAIHHATFILSNEYYKEPAELLQQTVDDLKLAGELNEPFVSLRHGESLDFCRNGACAAYDAAAPAPGTE